MKKRCLECKEPFIGRADKKYCTAGCRSAAYNRSNRASINLVRNINNILSKNRKILAQFNPNGKSKIHKEKLLGEGFKFNYFTNIYQTKAGNVYYFVYDQGYLPLENGYFTLVRRQSYVD